jgi:hypothetical protein
LAKRKKTIRIYQSKVQTIHWPKEKGQLEVSIEGTDNTLANRKRTIRIYQLKVTDNTLTNRKRTIRSYQLKVQTIHWPKEKDKQ